MLWANAQNEPLHEKIWDDFCAIDHSARLGHALLGHYQDMLMRYGHSAGFDYAVWAMVQDLVMHNGP